VQGVTTEAGGKELQKNLTVLNSCWNSVWERTKWCSRGRRKEQLPACAHSSACLPIFLRDTI